MHGEVPGTLPLLLHPDALHHVRRRLHHGRCDLPRKGRRQRLQHVRRRGRRPRPQCVPTPRPSPSSPSGTPGGGQRPLAPAASHSPHCSRNLAAVDAAALAERGYDENEVAAKMAGQPCLCQIVPGSGIGMLMLGVFLLLLSRIPPYLNRQHHQIKIVRASSSRPAPDAAAPLRSAMTARLTGIPLRPRVQTESGEKWPLWCITCMWMRQCAHPFLLHCSPFKSHTASDRLLSDVLSGVLSNVLCSAALPRRRRGRCDHGVLRRRCRGYPDR